MSTAGKSYEAWKESLTQAEANGDEPWSEEWDEASGPILRRAGAMEGNGLTVVLASLGLLLAGAIFLLPKMKHLTLGERTVGVVVGHQSYGYGKSGNIRVPVVRYSGPGGVSDIAGFLPAASSTYPLGKEVSVLYIPNDPRNAVIADFVQLFLIPTVVGGLGLACLSGATAFMYWTVRGELRVKPGVVTHRLFAVADRSEAVNGPAEKNDVQTDGSDEIVAEMDAAELDETADFSRGHESHAVGQA